MEGFPIEYATRKDTKTVQTHCGITETTLPENMFEALRRVDHCMRRKIYVILIKSSAIDCVRAQCLCTTGSDKNASEQEQAVLPCRIKPHLPEK